MSSISFRQYLLSLIVTNLWVVSSVASGAEAPAAAAARDLRADSRAVAPDRTPQVASIVRAREDGNAAGLSPLAAGAPFDAEAWATRPAYRRGWLEAAEPGRVFQTAPPAPDGVPLQRVGEPAPAIRQGQPVELAVRGRPGDPVTFTAAMGGVFRESETNAVTVAADEQGVARVHYVAYRGTTDVAIVLAGSPRCIGQVTFRPYIVEGQP